MNEEGRTPLRTVFVNQRERRRGDVVREDSERFGEAADELGLSGAERTRQADESSGDEEAAVFLGVQAGRLTAFPLAVFPSMVEAEFERAREPWWRPVEAVVRLLGQPGPSGKC